MSRRCLLLKLPDNREVFTYEKNRNALLEFAKTFDVKIITVDADFPNLLPLNKIAQIFCDHNQESFNTCSYRIATSQKKIPHQPNNREKMLQKVSDIRSYIESQFLEGNTIRIKELHHRFQKHNIAVSTIYRHLAYVKTHLKTQGKQIVKVETGCYRLLD